MTIYWVQVGPSPNMTGILKSKGEETQSKGSYVMTEAEMKLLCHNPKKAKDCWQPPQARET